jgi:Ran GTPase-activating protein (RanGAP) involved in mRNA processing and transport
VLTKTSVVSVQLLADTLKSNNTITRLDLRGNLLGDARAGLLVDALLQNTTLREINLGTNQLTCETAIAFAEVLRGNSTLTELGLSNNRIADMGATALIECLRSNNTIALIDLHLNTISPEKINQLLNSLMLNSQPKDLKQLLPDIQLNSSRVDRLNFSTYRADEAQKINDISARVLYNALRSNTTVTYVDLSNNRLTDNGAQQLAYMLEHNQTIQTLLLNNNAIGNGGAQALVEALRANAAITRLELDRNPITDYWKRQLAIAVKLNSEPLAFKKVAPALLINDAGVQVVDFSCLTGTLCTVNTCHLLCDVLQANTCLRELSLARNTPIGVDGVSVLCSMLAANKCSGLRTLDVSYVGLTDSSTPILAAMLRTNTSLTTLRVGGNPITSALDFIQVLGEHNHTLVQLDCTNTRLTEGDLRDINLLTRLNTQPLRFKHTIIDLFANNPTLTDLNLCEYEKSGMTQYRYLKCYNDQSMELLCEALVTNTHLRSLNLSNNQITDVGACALATVLQHNATLTTLNLSNNEITDMGGQRIARALLQNGSVTLVSIDKNKISPETRQRINQAAQTNALREDSLGKRLSVPPRAASQQLKSGLIGNARLPTEAELLQMEEDEILKDALRDQELLASVASRGSTMRQLLAE